MPAQVLIGYARTSTAHQNAGLEAQLRDLQVAGFTKVFREELSATTDSKRPELERALEFVREGDVLVVTKLDRLARSVAVGDSTQRRKFNDMATSTRVPLRAIP